MNRSASTQRGLRVLVVDDDPRVQAAMDVELTAAGVQATTIAPRWPPTDDDVDLAREFDVALVDVALPTVQHGIAVITELAREIPVVAFSIDGASRQVALTAGAAAYLEKDGDTDRLLETLRHTNSRHT
jgi:DNA-binding response OmpR family regulator